MTILPRAALAATALVLLAGCAGNRQAELAAAAPERLAGLPKSELLACAGVPERTLVTDGTEYYAYARARTLVHRDVDWEPSPWLPGRRTFLEPDVTEMRWDLRCEATFAIRGDRVQELSYRPGRNLQLCYEIVGGCLPAAG